MGARVLLPIAGLIGTLAGVVGLSSPPSNHRSEKPADNQADHNWKIEVDEINVEVTCAEKADGKVETGRRTSETSIFSWNVKLSEEESQMLKKSGVTVNEDVTLRDSKRALLWPKESTGMYIKKTGKNDELGIFYAPWSFKETKGVIDRNVRVSRPQWIYCKLDSRTGSKPELMFKSGWITREHPHYPFKPDEGLKVKVGLGDVCQSVESGKQLECNLKVTDGSDLDWSTKDNARARISF